jgi:hypothetical protein
LVKQITLKKSALGEQNNVMGQIISSCLFSDYVFPLLPFCGGLLNNCVMLEGVVLSDSDVSKGSCVNACQNPPKA